MKRSIYIEYTCGDKKGRSHWWVESPLSAISGFHRYMQRKLHKPHDGYRMTRIVHSYRDANDIDINSDFDVPGGPNPVLCLDGQLRDERQTELAGCA